MTTTNNTLAPTDEAIMAWAMSHQTDAIKVLRGSGFVRVARAVLAKFGTPAPASPPVATPAGMEPLTDSQITAARRAYPAEDLCGWSYRMGIADAEKHHGITAVLVDTAIATDGR